MPVPKPFRDRLIPPPRTVLSHFDKRDYEKPVPDIPLQPKFSFADQKVILDQGRSDYCTAFASFSCFFDHLPGANRGEFKTVFHTDNAFHKARDQMAQMRKDFFKRLLRADIWRWHGRNMRAALWHMNHGYTFRDRSKLMVDAYYRCWPSEPLDLCRYIQKYGSLFCGVMLRSQTFDGDIMINRGRIFGGHAVVIDGYDQERGLLHATNSWGAEWGRYGRFSIPFSVMRDIQEVWLMEGCHFEIAPR